MKFSILTTAIAVAFRIGQATADHTTCQTNVVINEVDADQMDIDTMEFIELHGPAGCSLEGLSVILFNGGSTDKSYNVIGLDGKMTNGQGFFVIGSQVVPNVDLVSFTDNGIQNGADAVALHQGDFPSNAPVGDINVDNIIDAIVYGTNDDDDTELFAALGQTVQYNDDTTNSLSRIPDGKGTGPNVAGTFVLQAPTPGALNVPPGQPTFSISDASAGEGDGTMTFTITRAGDMSGTDTVDYMTAADTATEGVDYTGVSNAITLTFAPSEATQTISITIIDDADFEGDEQFSVVLSNPSSGAAIDANPATGTIVDDENPPCQANVVINEVDSDTPGLDAAEFIELYGPADCSLEGLIVILVDGADDASNGVIDLTGQVINTEGFFAIGKAGVPNVDLTVDPRTIENGQDAVVLYRGDAMAFPEDTAVSSIMPANMIDVIVYGTNDADDELLLTALGQTTQFDEGDTETHSLSRVPDGTGAFVAKTPTPGAPNNPPLFSINNATALESDGIMSFTVTRTGDLTESVNVTFSTANGTAVEPTDYTATSETVNFAVGVETMMISVVIADNAAEGPADVFFTVTLSGPTDGFIEDAEGIGTIVDDESLDKTCQDASNSTTRDRALQAIAGQHEGDSRPVTSYLRVRALQSEECDPGYEYNPESRMCVDVDECATDYPCPGPVEGVTSSFCVDYDPPLRWKCGCLPGFEAVLLMDNNDFEQPVPTTWRPLTCLNENECETRSPCHPNATCTDTIGSYECICDAGLEGDGITCLAPGSPAPETIQDECQNKCNTGENQICAPSKVNNGTFACLCESGFSQIREGSKCDDDDECTAGAHDCDMNGFCDNIPGSFRCECLPGFVGGGRSCAATASPTSAPVVIEPIIETASPVAAVVSVSSGGGGAPTLKNNGEVCDKSTECISGNCVFPSIE